MAQNLVLSNGDNLLLANSTKSAIASASTHKLAFSPSATSTLYSDVTKSILEQPFSEITVSGSAERPYDWYESGDMDFGGGITSLKTGTTRILSGNFLTDMKETPSAYNGRTLAIKAKSGTLGSGNSIKITGIDGNAGVTKTTDLADHKEYRIDDATQITGNVYMEITIGTAANWASFVPTIYFTDQLTESTATDYRAIDPAWRTWLSYCNILRMMDLQALPVQTIAHPDENAQLGDMMWWNQVAHQADTQSQNKAAGLRNGCPIEPWLSWAADAYGDHKQLWWCFPVELGCPVRQAMLRDVAGSTSKGYFSPGIVDLTQTITLGQPAANGATISLGTGNRTFTIDASAATRYGTVDGVKETDSFTITFTDTQGSGSQSFIVPFWVQYVAASASYRIVVDYDEIWQSGASNENRNYLEDHWAFTDYADWLLDKLVASNYSTAVPFILEPSNELWNTAYGFAGHTEYVQGCALAYGQGAFEGVGIITAMFRKALEDRQAARGTNYTFTWLAPAQAANAATTTGFYNGADYANKSIHGLSAAQSLAKLNEYGNTIAMYYGGAFKSNGSGTTNYTGLTGQANADQIETEWTANSAQFWSDIEAWFTDETNDGIADNKWNYDQAAAHKAAAEALGGYFYGFYEGGSHDDDAGGSAATFPTEVKNITGFEAAWLDEWDNGDTQVNIWRNLCERMVSLKPDVVVMIYGGPEARTTASPWDWGFENATPSAFVNEVRRWKA